jgi:leucyl aminopeptidase
MNIQLLRQPIAEVKSHWLIVGLFEDEPESPHGQELKGLETTIRRLLSEKEVTGSLGELSVVHEPAGLNATSAVLVGLGPRGRFDRGAAFTAGVAASKRLAGKPRDTVAFVLPPSDDPLATATAIVEGTLVGTRSSALRKSELNRHTFGTFTIVANDGQAADSASLEAAMRTGEVIGRAVNLARDLANTPPAEKSPARLAERIRIVAEDAGLSVEIWDAGRIEQERFGGLVGVAAGSDEPPRFVILRHSRGGDAPTTALVGKGVTFDSGGLSIKPSASMEDMKADMTGAAVVTAAMQAVARLELPVNLVGYLALTENMTGGRAMKLGDVLTHRNGKTVEVLNTDAEGRLILADALSFAVESHPARMLDLATLTGACMVALGTRIAGLFGNDEAFCDEFLEASRQTGERAWRMPLDEDFKESLKSHVADLKNVGGKWGGAATAAKFLQQFVGNTPWIHLDIAGPSWADSDSPTRDIGATGCFVRTLVRHFERTSDKI